MKAQNQVFHYLTCIDCRWFWNSRSTSGEECLWPYPRFCDRWSVLWYIKMNLRGLCMSLILAYGSSYTWRCLWYWLMEAAILEDFDYHVCDQVCSSWLGYSTMEKKEVSKGFAWKSSWHAYNKLIIDTMVYRLRCCPIMKQVLLLNPSIHNMILWETSMWLLQDVSVDHKCCESAMK